MSALRIWYPQYSYTRYERQLNMPNPKADVRWLTYEMGRLPTPNMGGGARAAAYSSTYLAGTSTRRVRRALAAVFAEGVGKDVVSRVWRKVRTGLGCLERPLARRGADRAAHPRRHGGPSAARPQGDLDLPPRRHRRARGRAEGAARREEYGRRDHRGLACRPRRPHRPRPAPAAVPHRGRRTRAREGARRHLGRCADTTVHGSQADADESRQGCAKRAR